jgi:hypothetical protein
MGKKKKPFIRSQMSPLFTRGGPSCTCGSCKNDDDPSQVSKLKAADVPHEKPFFEAVLRLFNAWYGQTFDVAAFRDDFINALRDLCAQRCNDVLGNDILTDDYLQSLEVTDWFAEVMQEPIKVFVDEFLREYTQMIIESMIKKQKKTDDWQAWAYSETRADMLATDINSCLESGTHLTFQAVYTAAVEEANR